jgi:hypothetical protein
MICLYLFMRVNRCLNRLVTQSILVYCFHWTVCSYFQDDHLTSKASWLLSRILFTTSKKVPLLLTFGRFMVPWSHHQGVRCEQAGQAQVQKGILPGATECRDTGKGITWFLYVIRFFKMHSWKICYPFCGSRSARIRIHFGRLDPDPGGPKLPTKVKKIQVLKS